MPRAALYSRASRSRTGVTRESSGTNAPVATEPSTQLPSPSRGALKRFLAASRLPLWILAGLVAVFSGTLLERQINEPPTPVSQRDIDHAVRVSLEKKPLPSRAAKAFETIGPSVVRVLGFDSPHPHGNLPAQETNPKVPGKKHPGKPRDKAQSIPSDKVENAAPSPRTPQDGTDDENTSIGTGVVITEKGAILTSLHVVAGARRLRVIFADGSASDAVISGVDPGNDLAVLQATTLPDDLQPATLTTTGDLRPGDDVVAVGFPFGFGPSVSSGVVSGLKREFLSTDGERVLGNLIQFDAAANPGNSGGPLVNMDGEVVGIVTAILNPTSERFFVGLAFAVPIENAAAAVGISPF